MIAHAKVTNAQLRQLIRKKKISLAGNRTLKIYGLLSCSSGKRMHNANRVFFINAHEAIQQGYRPCGHCLNYEYKIWKSISR